MNNFLNYELLHLGNYKLTIGQIIAIVVLAISFRVSLWFLKGVLRKYKKFDDGQRFTFYTISKYFLFIFFFSISLKILGINVSVLIAGSAALLVGIGLGLQALFHDFISGIILLAEGTIKVGNVIEIDNKRVEILAIRFRTSVVKTREEKEIIVPNSYLTKNEIINWSNQKNINRHYVELLVNDTNIEKTMELIKNIVKTHPKVNSNPEPYVRIEAFEFDLFKLRVMFWSEEVFAVGRMLGEVRLLIHKTLKENKINLPLPHQVITLNKI